MSYKDVREWIRVDEMGELKTVEGAHWNHTGLPIGGLRGNCRGSRDSPGPGQNGRPVQRVDGILRQR
jgi:hypothetical protein